MPATLEARPRERAAALVAVALIQLALGIALLLGLRVDVVRPGEAAQRLIAVVLDKPPPPPLPPPPPKPQHHPAAAPKAQPAPPGAAPSPKPVPVQAPPTPKVAIRPTPSPAAGGSGTGAAFGRGSGGGTGGTGTAGSGNGDDGGTDLELISGALSESDVPRDLRDRHIGGRVEFLMTVGPNGRVTRCAITRSSGVPRLDALTCALVQQRFVFRPSTDRYGRPITDEMDGTYDWDR